MATIQTRKGKTGESYRVGYYDDTGKFRFTPTFKNRAGAEKIADIIDKRGYKTALRIINANQEANTGVTLAEWFDTYLDRKAVKLEPATIHDYRNEAERTWLPKLGDLPISTITQQDVREWIQWQVQQETHRSKKKREKAKLAGIKPLPPVERVAPKTVRNAHSNLSSVLDAATYEEPPLLIRNPAKKAELPPLNIEEEKEIFTREEWDEFYAAMPDHYKPFIAFLLVSGTRIGEATAVRVGDFNFKAGTVSLVRAWKKGVGARVIGTPKSKRSRRVVMIDGWAMDAFKKLAEGRDKDELMFVAPRGGQIHPHRFNERQWHPTLASTSIRKNLTPHSLRHTFASWQLMAGVPAQVVQFRLGHSDLSVTSKVYSHLLLEEQKSGAMAMSWEPKKALEV